MRKSLATLLTALILFSCGWTPACIAEPTETDAVWEQVSEAYIYAFPLVLTNATKTMSTNTNGSVTGRAPVNQINHAKRLADASFRTVVTPNVDTVYSQAWLDISTEPMVYVLPETDRFCNVQLLDAWTNTAAVLDQAGAYVIALPSWTGELPENVTRVDVPTETVWSIARVVLSGNEDLPNVYAIQDQMRLLPLSAYLAGGDYAAPAGTYAKENDFVPVNKVLSMPPAEFFNTANALMQANLPPSAGRRCSRVCAPRFPPRARNMPKISASGSTSADPSAISERRIPTAPWWRWSGWARTRSMWRSIPRRIRTRPARR